MWVKGTTVVWVSQPGEVPPPGFPDQGLPEVPPGFWGPPIYPGQPLPPSRPGRPPVAGQPLPRPPWTWPTDPGWGVEEGAPGQGLPGEPERAPKVADIGDRPLDPPTSGQWMIAAYNNDARWVFVPHTDTPEVEPPD
jgi:hypothetical protein